MLTVVLTDQCSFLGLQIFHQPPDPNVPLPQPQSRPGSRRSRAICLSTGPRKPRSLYTPTLCLADAESKHQSGDYHHRSSQFQNLLAAFNIHQTQRLATFVNDYKMNVILSHKGVFNNL